MESQPWSIARDLLPEGEGCDDGYALAGAKLKGILQKCSFTQRSSYRVTSSGFSYFPGHRRALHQKLQKLILNSENSVTNSFLFWLYIFG